LPWRRTQHPTPPLFERMGTGGHPQAPGMALHALHLGFLGFAPVDPNCDKEAQVVDLPWRRPRLPTPLERNIAWQKRREGGSL